MAARARAENASPANRNIEGRAASMSSSIFPDPPRSSPSSPGQRRALGISAFVAVAALVALAAPVSSGLFLGTLLAFTLLGTYERLSRRWPRPTLVAVALASASGLVMLGSLFGIAYFIVMRSASLARQLAVGVQPKGGFLNLTQWVEQHAPALPFGPLNLTERVQAYAEE